jgi:hypothetical protein
MPRKVAQVRITRQVFVPISCGQWCTREKKGRRSAPFSFSIENYFFKHWLINALRSLLGLPLDLKSALQDFILAPRSEVDFFAGMQDFMKAFLSAPLRPCAFASAAQEALVAALAGTATNGSAIHAATMSDLSDVFIGISSEVVSG